MQITLWGELAKKFDENNVRSMTEPVVIAFGALSAKQFQGNLLLLYYQKCKHMCILYFLQTHYYIINHFISKITGLPCLNSTGATAYYLNPDITEAKTLKRRLIRLLFPFNIIIHICLTSPPHCLITISLTYFSIKRFAHQTQHLEFLEPSRKTR